MSLVHHLTEYNMILGYIKIQQSQKPLHTNNRPSREYFMCDSFECLNI